MVFVDRLGELVNGWWDLEPVQENSLLSLNSNVLRPFDEASEIPLWLHVAPDSEIACILCEQRVLISFGTTLGATSSDDFRALLDLLDL